MVSKLAIGVLVALASCAPEIATPLDHQRTIDREDADRLAAQIAQLPAVVTATVVLHRASRDPLALAAPSPGMLSVVIATDDRAEPAAIRIATDRLARAVMPELPSEPVIIINPVVQRPALAQVGPFTVEAGSRNPLRAAFAIGLVAIAALAGYIALRERRQRLGNSAQ